LTGLQLQRQIDWRIRLHPCKTKWGRKARQILDEHLIIHPLAMNSTLPGSVADTTLGKPEEE
jgi:hypothetical protein